MDSTNTNLTRIGYWRPLVITSDTRPVATRDGLYITPVLATTIDDIDGVADARNELEAYRATGKHRHIHRSDIHAAGSVEAYLTRYLERLVMDAKSALALPIPVAGTMQADDARNLATWLEGGQVIERWRGYSTCRLCGSCTNGDTDMARDGYVYPSGLIHYVRDHHAAVPGLEMDSRRPGGLCMSDTGPGYFAVRK